MSELSGPHELMNRALGGNDNPDVCMRRLLALETPEDAARVRDALEDGWKEDWAGAFNRAARKVLGSIADGGRSHK
jgi:hypothetical protein